MRRLVAFSTASFLRFQKFDQDNRLSGSDDFFLHAEESGYFVKDADAQGYYRLQHDDEIPCITVYFAAGISFEDANAALAVLSEKCICMYHPKKIICTNGRSYIHVFHANAYYEKGTCMQKIIEPWRLLLSDSTFDAEGYIINQGAMKQIPFGWFDTMAKGCGWIAAYNLLKMCGQEQTMQETAEELGRYTLLGGMVGQELYTLLFYLSRKGLNAKLSLSWDASALRCIHQSRYGILLYSHSQGAHYTAYRKLSDGRLLFYNAVYGRRNHIEDAGEFLQQREFLPLSSVIYIK